METSYSSWLNFSPNLNKQVTLSFRVFSVIRQNSVLHGQCAHRTLPTKNMSWSDDDGGGWGDAGGGGWGDDDGSGPSWDAVTTDLRTCATN